ncbi:MAG: tRNA lysidine(34) synthetase TilS [Planctomycetes bacterium]|nr:tRNA lysidine(34) synthetase TilS [Planctomycetota bacterium]
MSLHPLERKVLRASRALLGDGPVVVGASGGADSTALLAALVAGGRDVVAAHLDHGLRGEEARRDRDAARAVADRLGVDLVDGVADAADEARRRGTGSLEAAARAVRYRFLLGVALERGADRVAVGHTADDQAETVLLRALRGAGLAGLSGIPRRRALGEGVLLVRPLLRVTRAEVEDHLRARGLADLVVEDGSNRDRRFLRNRLRHDVLPLLREQVNPRADEALRRLAAQARKARRHLDGAAATLLAEAERASGLALAPLRAADPAVRNQALQRLVALHAPDRAAAEHVRALARLVARGRGRCDLPGGVRLEAVGERLVAVSPGVAAPAAAPVSLAVPGEAVDAGRVFEARLRPAAASDTDLDPARGACLDAARARGALAVRRRREGDRFWPLGAPGTRSLKRFLIDRKVPRDERASTPVVTLDDQPVWIVGHRIDERFKVTPATDTVLELQVRAAAGEKGM